VRIRARRFLGKPRTPKATLSRRVVEEPRLRRGLADEKRFPPASLTAGRAAPSRATTCKTEANTIAAG